MDIARKKNKMKRTSKVDMKNRIAIIGLGYVGLPLAVEFSAHYDVIGFDISERRIDELNNGFDITNAYGKEELLARQNVLFTSNGDMIADCNIYIITVPTPVDKHKVPNLELLKNATRLISKYITAKDIIIYESTVYPGTTKWLVEEILQHNLNNVLIDEIIIGYSPERINPGDKTHTLRNIKKLVGCDNDEGRRKICALYQKIIDVGVVECDTIEIAEGAKIIENTQRDVNIALMNELKILFDKLNINFSKVLSATETKWNFLKFSPGLVGGHCISVDPYYLAHVAKSMNYNPEMILSGRRINDTMANYEASECIKSLIQSGFEIRNLRALVFGFAFKADCGDPRNTKVFDLISELKSYGLDIEVFDPLVDSEQVYAEYGLKIISDQKEYDTSNFELAILAVRHSYFLENINSLISREDGMLPVYEILNGWRA